MAEGETPGIKKQGSIPAGSWARHFQELKFISSPEIGAVAEPMPPETVNPMHTTQVSWLS
jgi:hypothetical protein